MAVKDPQLKETLDVVKEMINDDRAKTDKEIGELHERVAAFMLNGPGRPAPGGMDRDEYRAAAKSFFSTIARREVSDSEIDYDALKAYENAFPEYLRRGGAVSTDVQNTLRIGSDPDGGFWSPPQMTRDILQRLYDTSPMRQVASQMTIDAPSVEFPIDTNDLASGGWVGEMESRPNTTSPTVGIQEFFLREQYANPEVTQRLLDMSSFDINGWLSEKIADKLRRGENTAFVSGDGTDRPRGFLSYKDSAVTTDDSSRDWGVLQYVATGASGGFPTVSGSSADDPDTLITLKSKLKPDYLPGARWMMNRATAATVRRLKDADGRYLWVDSIQQGEPDMLLGYATTLAEDLPDIAADSFSIAFGDFSRYLILDHVVGVRIVRDNLTTKGRVSFYSTKYTGGDQRDFDAVKLLKFGTS